jgi:hypothetical protein
MKKPVVVISIILALSFLSLSFYISYKTTKRLEKYKTAYQITESNFNIFKTAINDGIVNLAYIILY